MISKAELSNRIWSIRTVTELDPGISRATAQDWLSKKFAAGQIVSTPGKRDSYLFSAEELIHILVLACLSRYGILQVRDTKRVKINLNEETNIDDIPPGSRDVTLRAPKQIINFYRKLNFQAGIIIQWSVEQHFSLFKSDSRVKAGDLSYFLELRPYEVLQQAAARWISGEDKDAHNPGEAAWNIGFVSVKEIAEHVISELALDRGSD